MRLIREILGIQFDAPIPADEIAVVKMATTVATNAALERKGNLTVLAKDFGMRYESVTKTVPISLPVRLFCHKCLMWAGHWGRGTLQRPGEEWIPINLDAVRPLLQAAYDDGILSGAIVFLHGYRYPEHEKRMATIAKEIGFIQISVSHEVSALMKIVSQGDTNEIISFLTPGH